MQLPVPDGVPALAAVAVTSIAVESWVGGVRSIADPTPASRADRFHLGSNTKAMTATVVARAVEQGRLSWEDDAAVVLGLEPPRGVTIERLLAPTAGLRALTEDHELAGLPAGRAATAALLLADEPRFEPGTAASYSNGGYAVVAAVLEDVYGAPLEEVLRVELFEPLQLEAGFGWPPDLLGHYARGDGLEVHDTRDGYRLPPALTAAGDVNATIDSYGRFCSFTSAASAAGLSCSVPTRSPASTRRWATASRSAGAFRSGRVRERVCTQAARRRSSRSSRCSPSATSERPLR